MVAWNQIKRLSWQQCVFIKGCCHIQALSFPREFYFPKEKLKYRAATYSLLQHAHISLGCAEMCKANKQHNLPWCTIYQNPYKSIPTLQLLQGAILSMRRSHNQDCHKAAAKDKEFRPNKRRKRKVRFSEARQFALPLFHGFSTSFLPPNTDGPYYHQNPTRHNNTKSDCRNSSWVL